MFSFRFMGKGSWEGSHTLTTGEELVEWEALKDHGSSARVAATVGSTMLLLIGIPCLFLLYGAPGPQKIAAVSEEPAPLVVREPAGQQLSVPQTHKSAALGAAREHGPGVQPSTPQVPRAWYVQLAAFSERAAAQQLTHQAKTAGFPALLYDGGSLDKPRFRVLVGPQSSSAAARQMQHRVGSLLFLNGMFVRYIE